MLGSKKIGLISVVLIAMVLIGTLYFMINPVEPSKNRVTYENGQTVIFADDEFFTVMPDDFTHIDLSLENSVFAGGVYRLSGVMENTFTVDATSTVVLILDGVTIDAPEHAIEVKGAGKVVLASAPDSVNTLRSKSGEAVLSKDDITVTGLGRIVIESDNDALKSSDGIKITGGTVEICAGDEGMVANDFIIMRDGAVTINSGSKAIKCENDKLGFISLEGGSLDIDAGGDAIWASSEIYVSDTDAKISSGDDALHAEGSLALNGGKIEVLECYEGFEGGNIVINDGEFSINAQDDAFNATGVGYDMRDVLLTINGGKIHALTGGDGLDSNAAAVINGGYLEVFGPENPGNSTLDFDGGFTINGGTVITAGSAGMAKSPSEGAQNVIAATLDKAYERESSIALVDEAGNTVVSGVCGKRFDWVCISAPEILENSRYTLKVADEIVCEIAVDGKVTTVGERRGGFRR